MELGKIFPDQKTFADAVPKQSPSLILALYRRQRNKPGFSLKAFVTQHFRLPSLKEVNYQPGKSQSIESYIEKSWSVLERKPTEIEQYSSLLPLKYPYIVPGGRFSEIYYWDSYFTMLGLEQDGHHTLARDMLNNFATMIDRYGHVPNGNRTYYLSRSQPPFFSCMIELIAAHDGNSTYVTYLPQLQAEYNYWMGDAATLTRGSAYHHAVKLADGTIFNRFWDNRSTPRDESFLEDFETAKQAKRPAAQVYRDLRAGAESGWDFSSRWLKDGVNLSTIDTTDIAPVDLNSLMAHLEQVLSKSYRLKGDLIRSRYFQRQASMRIEAISRLMWDPRSGTFRDYLWKENRQNAEISAATVFPLFFGLASRSQAFAIGNTLRSRFLDRGGMATTLQSTGQQWDRPNGWAPLQYLAIEGLKRYGQDRLASEIARRWINENVQFYRHHKILVEKYNIEERMSQAHGGKGGEYPLQVGFGWTNGVLAVLLAQYSQFSKVTGH